MPVDTRDRRASAAGGEWDIIYPNPSGSLATAAKRSHIVGLYAMAAAAPVVPTFDGITLDASYRALVLLAATLDGSVALDADYRAHAALSATYGGSVALTASYRTRIELEASSG